MPERPLTIPRLALANIMAKPWRAAGLAALVSVFSFALFAGALIDRQLAKGLGSLSERLGADLLIVPYGYEAKAKSAILRGEPSTCYMPAAVLDKLKIFPGVAAATPQFYLASLSTECCSERVQIIAYDPETDFLIKPWLDKAAVGALGEAEIVVGSKLNVEVGGQLYFFGVVHTVAARMEPTGMGLDTSVLMPLEGVRQIIGSVGDPAGRMPDPSAFISTVALKIEDGLRVKDVANAIMRAEAIEFGLDMVLPGAIVTETSRRLSGWSRLTGWLSAGLWLLALLSLALVFSVSAGERSAEFGIYRLLGATRPWLGRLLLAEAAAVAAAGALAGLVLAALVVFPFNALIFGALGLPALPLTAPEIALRALAGAALGVAVAPLASLRAVWRLTRVDVAGNLRSDA